MENFFAYVNRMKYIERWSLMFNSRKENILEHSAQVSMLAHALATIKNKLFNGSVNAERLATLAIYHDASEVITGDLPTPVKYYNQELKTAYKELESVATDKLINMLPDELKEEYSSLLQIKASDEEKKILKAADKLSAYIKCLEELNFGNKEFIKAKASLEKDLKSYELQELDYFMEHFIPPFKKTLDELD